MKITDRRPLGRTGLSTTIASYGGGSLGNFGRVLTNAQADEILHTAWRAGVRYFDTAPYYGRGRSERRIGQFLEERAAEEYVLSTKVGRLMRHNLAGTEGDGLFLDPSPFDAEWDYSYDGVMRSYEDSLQRLGVERIDILYVHDIGERLHGEDAARQLATLKDGGLKALEQLRADGAIAGYGLGVTEVGPCLDCLDYGDPDAFLLAGRYSLLDHTAARPLLDKCVETGVSLVIGGVFASGILATGAVPDARYDYQPATPEVLDRVRAIEAICARHSVPLPAAALQFALNHPAVASVLLGAGSVRSVEQCIAGIEADIPAALWAELREEGVLPAR